MSGSVLRPKRDAGWAQRHVHLLASVPCYTAAVSVAFALNLPLRASAQPTTLPWPEERAAPYATPLEDLDVLLRHYTAPADHPTPPGDTFAMPRPQPSFTPSGPLPQVGSFTRQAGINQSVVLQGISFTGNAGASAGLDTRVWVYNQTTSSNGQLFEAQLLKTTPETVTAVMAGLDTVPLNYGMFMVWPANAAGVGSPVRVNGTEAWWLGPYHAAVDEEVSVYGRNLSRYQGITQSFIYLRPWNASANTPSIPCGGCVTDINPYRVTFTVPQLTANADYEVWIHNGHGGVYGWSGPLKLHVDPHAYEWPSEVSPAVDDPCTQPSCDDSQALQDALDRAQNGQTVTLDAGTYKLGSALTIPRGVSLQGAGKNLTIIETTSSFNQDAMVQAKNIMSPIRLQNLTLRVLPGAAVRYGMFWVNAPHTPTYPEGVLISNVQFEAADSSGEPFPNSDVIGAALHWLKDVRVTHCKFVGTSLELQYSQYAFIRDNDYFGTVSTSSTGGAGDAQGAGYGVTNAHYVDFSENRAESHDRPNGLFARRMYIGGANWWPAINHYIADNVATDCSIHAERQPDNSSGENIGLESSRPLLEVPDAGTLNVTFLGTPMLDGGALPGQTTFSFSDVSWTPNDWVTYQAGQPDLNLPLIKLASTATITRGPGTGQWRRILSNTSHELTIDRPWDVPPTSTSSVLVGGGFYRAVVYRNTITGPSVDHGNTIPDYYEHAQDASTRDLESSGVAIFGRGSEVVVANNLIRNLKHGVVVSGFGSNLRSDQPIFDPQHDTVVTDNTVAGAVAGVHLQTHIIQAPDAGLAQGDPGVGPTMLNTIVRSNTLHSTLESGIRLRKQGNYGWSGWRAVVQNTVFESNVIWHPVVGISLPELHTQSILYNNDLQRTVSAAGTVGIELDYDPYYETMPAARPTLIGNTLGAFAEMIVPIGGSNQPYAWWRMEEGWSGAYREARSSSWLDHDGRATYGANTDAGVIGLTGQFNGVNQAVVTSDATALELRDDMTVSAWIRTSTVKVDQVIVQKYQFMSPFRGWSFRLSGNLLQFFTDGAARFVHASAPGLFDGQWHHVAATKAVGSPMQLYIDGVEVPSYGHQDIGARSGSTVGSPLSISWGSPSWAFQGNIDEVRLYGRALTPQQVTDLYAYPYDP